MASDRFTLPAGNPQDNEDIAHRAASREPTNLEYKMDSYTDKADKFVCSLCKGETFVIIASFDENGYIQLICAAPRCPGRTKVMELRKPQMNDAVARRLGLYIPSRVPLIDDVIDLSD